MKNNIIEENKDWHFFYWSGLFVGIFISIILEYAYINLIVMFITVIIIKFIWYIINKYRS